MGGPAPTEEDFSRLPLEDRLSSKNWKARVSGYEELSKAFEKSPSESAPIFKPYTRNPDLLKAMVTDSNAVAQEKALDTVKSFVQYGGRAAGATREVVIPPMIDKCIGAMRAGTKKSAFEIVELYAEMEDVLGCEGIILNVLQGTNAKQPKLVAGCTSALSLLVGDFGPKQLNLKPILKKLPELFSHSDKGVRSEASNLALELYKWLGSAIEPVIASLKDIQARELREQFAKMDQSGSKRIVPSRYLRSQQPQSADDGPDPPTGDDKQVHEVQEVDPLEFTEPSDPFKAKEWPRDFEELINSTKWLERKEVLDQCLKVLENTPKIVYSPAIDSFIDVLSIKVKKDANINVVLVACQCITKVASGLRGEFAKNKDKVLSPLLEKLKERKESTVKVLAETLDAVFSTITLSDILEPVLAASKHKNPAVKTGAIQFLVRCLRKTKMMPAKGDIKPIADALVAAMSDGSADVRDAGAQGLGTLMKLIGERPMNQYLDGLDEIKKGKVQEQFREATVSVQGAAAPPKAPSAKPATTSESKTRPNVGVSSTRKGITPVADKENAPPTSLPPSSRPLAKSVLAARTPPASLMAPKSTKAGVATVHSKTATSAPKVAGRGPLAATEPVKFRFHQEEADAQALQLVPGHIVDDLSNNVWKERLAGMTKFNEWLKMEVETVESELIARFLSKKPGWKESNFQVMGEMYNALRMLAQDSGTFGRPTVALSVAPLCEKLGDMKLKVPAGETLSLFAEKTSLGFVLAQAITPLGNIKAPKAIADSLLWINQAILDFGSSGLDVRSLVDHLLSCLKSANAGVRTNATLVIGTLARFLGPALSTFLSDLNTQLRSTVEAEIEKATQQSAPTPTRFSNESKPKASESSSVSVSSVTQDIGAEEDALDALIPRVDLDALVPAVLITRMSDANWKERKEALEELNGILDANTRLKPKMNDLSNALKLRYSDSNIQIRTLALDAITKIAKGMSKGFDQHVKTFTVPVTQIMADAKLPMRSAAAKALTAMAEHVSVGPMIPGFVSVLESKTANPMLRQDLFAWLGAWFHDHPPEKGVDLNGLIFPAITCLDDKLAAVRKAAQSVLPYLIIRCGYKAVMEQTSNMKAASRNTVIPLIDAARAEATGKGSGSAPQVSAPAAAIRTPMSSRGGQSTQASSAPVSVAPAPRSRTISQGHSDEGSNAQSQSIARQSSAVSRTLRAPSSTQTNGATGSTQTKSGTISLSSQSRAVASSNAPAISPSSPFNSKDTKFKAIREKKESNRNAQYWISSDGSPRQELTDVLHQQCEPQMSTGLLDKMFSKDHNAERDFLSALTLLADYLSNPVSAAEEYSMEEGDIVNRAIANSDLIFKYVALRLTDNNTSISIKCLDVLESLIATLRNQEYHMSDYEANAILPCILAKFGDPKVAFRDRIRNEIMRKLTYIYPPSKILGLLLEDGITSKNSRVRTECLDEIRHLFQRYGTQICSLPKAIPQIARQISDRDNAVRTGALLAIGEVYKVVGEEEIWRLVGKLPPRDASLLEERLKRTTAPAASAPHKASPIRPQPSTNSSPTRPKAALSSPSPSLKSGRASNVTSTQSRLAVPSRLARPASMITGTTAQVTSGIPTPTGGAASAVRNSRLPAPHQLVNPSSLSTSNVPTPAVAQSKGTPESGSLGIATNAKDRVQTPQANSEEDAVVEQAISEILSSDSDCSVNALKQIERQIQSIAPALTRHADQLAIAFQKQLHRAFSVEKASLNNERLKKHLLITGTSIFDNTRLWEDASGQRTLGSFVSKAALVSLLTELLQQLIHTKGATDEETQTHGRYLNIIVLRSFSSCNLNALFGACLSMLTEATEDLEDMQARDPAIFERRIKFADLICKCIWKITRKLNASLQDELIDAAHLLQDLEHFLQVIPPSQWKKRASMGMPLGEMPLRTVKVIITHIGSVFGEESLDLLEGIPHPEQSHVYAHLLKVCDRGTEVLSASATMEALEDEMAAAPTSPTHRPIAGPRHPSYQSSTSPRETANNHSPNINQGRELGKSPSIASTASHEDGDDAANAELRNIFDRIASKSESRAAIKDLYQYQRKYPHKEPSIRRSLEQTGPIFQKFIRRALANHAAEEGEPAPLAADDDSTARRDSVLSSPGNLGSARGSTYGDWQSTSAAVQRSSYMSPSSSRNSHLSIGNGNTIHHGSPGSPSSHNLRQGTPESTTTVPRAPLQSGANDDRLAQLRAKFARKSSNPSAAH